MIESCVSLSGAVELKCQRRTHPVYSLAVGSRRLLIGRAVAIMSLIVDDNVAVIYRHLTHSKT